MVSLKFSRQILRSSERLFRLEGFMIVDRYTKFILTIIAIALCVLASTQLVSLFMPEPAIAKGGSSPVQRVTICNERGEFCAMVDETGRLYVK